VNEELQGKIRDRAYRLWEADGRPEGTEHEHWLEAERQVMDEEGMGEPSAGAGQELAPGDRPEPQPEMPSDPLRNPEYVPPASDPDYPASPGLQEMPADRSPQPEIPAEPGIADIPAPEPGPGTTARRARPAASTAKPRATRGGKGKGGEASP
jgi:hypothetical protein